MKIPEDYTFYGVINGSIYHRKNNVSGKLRTNKFDLEVEGQNETLQWQSV